MYVLLQTKPEVKIILITSMFGAAEASLSLLRRVSGFHVGYEIFQVTSEHIRMLLDSFKVPQEARH